MLLFDRISCHLYGSHSAQAKTQIQRSIHVVRRRFMSCDENHAGGRALNIAVSVRRQFFDSFDFCALVSPAEHSPAQCNGFFVDELGP